MHTSAKGAPKSCSCGSCRRGKGTRAGNLRLKAEERAARRAAKVDLRRTDGELIPPAHRGDYKD